MFRSAPTVFSRKMLIRKRILIRTPVEFSFLFFYFLRHLSYFYFKKSTKMHSFQNAAPPFMTQVEDVRRRHGQSVSMNKMLNTPSPIPLSNTRPAAEESLASIFSPRNQPFPLHAQSAHTAAELDMYEEIQQKEKDIGTLLAIVSQQAQTSQGDCLAAIRILQEDLDKREKAVMDREARVWGWRLIANAKEEEFERELEKGKKKEQELMRRERSIVDKEAELAARERALEQRTLLLNEEQAAHVRRVRTELGRMRRKLGLPDHDTSLQVEELGLSAQRSHKKPNKFDASKPFDDL